VSYEIPNYTLLHRLGEGAMAEVWLAEHRRNGRKAAIKILKPAAVADSDFEKLFHREGQVLAGFDHPNIVRIYDNDRIGDIAFLVMEYLAGGTLAQRMQRGPITIGEALGLTVQIAGALGVAHRMQIIHRDLKPANIMLRDETTPVLTDFGAVRVLDRSTIYGRDGMVVGTPLYMSPEQLSGQPLAGSSDLYALGILFHELLTGARPFPGISFQEIAAQHLFAPIPRLPAAISMLQPVLEQLLAKKPEERYAEAQTCIDELRAVFINDEALRLQVGYAGTSMAWSSQLRALGFALDTVQKNEVRVAQGEFLRGVDELATPTGSQTRHADEPVTLVAPQTTPSNSDAQAPASAPIPDTPDAATVQRLITPAPRVYRHYAGIVVVAALLLGGGWWWTHRGAPVIDPPPGPLPTLPLSAPPPIAATAPADDTAAGYAAIHAAMQSGPETPPLGYRFSALPNGRVLDSQTHLQWAGWDNGANIDWSDARAHCQSMGSGWALPTPRDLIVLYDETGELTHACGDAVCGVTPLLTLTDRFHWTSSKQNDRRAWAVDLSNGTRKSMAIINPFHLRALCVQRTAAEDAEAEAAKD
jgi:hypothetical protein